MMMKPFFSDNARCSWRITLIALLSIFLSSCMSVKPGAVRSGQKYYESFFVGEEGTQYFIKPLSFESADGQLILDIVFRYNNEIKGNATINYSIISSELFKIPGKVTLQNPLHEVTANDAKLLFNERDGKRYLSRFSVTIPLADLITLFKDNNWQILVRHDALQTTTEMPFKPGKKTRKIIDKLNSNVFILF